MSEPTPALAERMSHIALSPTMKGTIAAEKLKREGKGGSTQQAANHHSYFSR